MKIAQMKAFVGVAAIMLVGGTAYAVMTVARAETAKSAQQQRENVMLLNAPVPSPDAVLPPPEAKDADRNVVLTGKVLHEDGRPAGGIQVGAQIQNKARGGLMQQLVALHARLGAPQNQPLRISKQDQKWSWNNAVSKPDGSYELPVSADLPYNIMVFDTTGKWVAAAVEGASGARNTTVEVPDLILTKGSLVVGRVTDRFGVPVPNVVVQSYGPHRPATTAATIGAVTDLSGHYRLRVSPGQSQVYVGYVTSGSGTPRQNVKMTSRDVAVAARRVETVDFVAP